MAFMRMLFSKPSVMVLIVTLLSFGWMPVMADAPTPWQMGFQDPATAAMEGIVDLHHDICFFLVTILVLLES